jgi:hypothetical protein
MSKTAKKQRPALGPVERTERGFEIIRFKDDYQEPCSLQASSVARHEKPGTSAVWLGPESNRMHLDRAQVQLLINHLRTWLRSDSFDLGS